ncbi:MAG: FecR family protein [Planctomycetes bacterium]|nr:FecR family protein [Planctomycetota bacterium]
MSKWQRRKSVANVAVHCARETDVEDEIRELIEKFEASKTTIEESGEAKALIQSSDEARQYFEFLGSLRSSLGGRQNSLSAEIPADEDLERIGALFESGAIEEGGSIDALIADGARDALLALSTFEQSESASDSLKSRLRRGGPMVSAPNVVVFKALKGGKSMRRERRAKFYKVGAVAAAALIVVSAIAVMFSDSFFEADNANVANLPPESTPRRTDRSSRSFTLVGGSLTMFEPGSARRPLKSGDSIEIKDRVIVQSPEGETAVLKFADECFVAVREGSELILASNDEIDSVSVSKGGVHVETSLSKKTTEVLTIDAKFVAEDTSFEVAKQDSGTTLSVYEGKVRVYSPGVALALAQRRELSMVTSGQMLRITLGRSEGPRAAVQNLSDYSNRQDRSRGD